jgi:hypothetical protein
MVGLAGCDLETLVVSFMRAVYYWQDGRIYISIMDGLVVSLIILKSLVAVPLNQDFKRTVLHVRGSVIIFTT